MQQHAAHAAVGIAHGKGAWLLLCQSLYGRHRVQGGSGREHQLAEVLQCAALHVRGKRLELIKGCCAYGTFRCPSFDFRGLNRELVST